MTKEELAVLQALAAKGYAVIVWTPEELGNAAVKDVEDRSIEFGYEVIASLQQTNETN